MWAVTATREAAASVVSCVFLPAELALPVWCVLDRPREAVPADAQRQDLFSTCIFLTCASRRAGGSAGWRDVGTSRRPPVLSGSEHAAAAPLGTEALSSVEAGKTEPSSAPPGTKPVDD